MEDTVRASKASEWGPAVAEDQKFVSFLRDRCMLPLKAGSRAGIQLVVVEDTVVRDNESVFEDVVVPATGEPGKQA